MKLHLSLLQKVIDLPSSDPVELRHTLDDLGLEVKDIEGEGKDTVYNIEVNNYSNYFVDGVLVHNKGCGCLEAGSVCQNTTWKCSHLGPPGPNGMDNCGACCNSPPNFDFECGATGGTDCNLCQGLGTKSCR